MTEATELKPLYFAAMNCGHRIDDGSITLYRDSKLPGNALSQLADRLDRAAVHAPVQHGNFVQPVPDHCDRIVWRGIYLHLASATTRPNAVMQEPASWVSLKNPDRIAIFNSPDVVNERGIAIATAAVNLAEARLKQLNLHPPTPGAVEPIARHCPNESMGMHGCTNRAQCWEPCGELGHSAEHARVSTQQHVAKVVPTAEPIRENVNYSALVKWWGSGAQDWVDLRKIVDDMLAATPPPVAMVAPTAQPVGELRGGHAIGFTNEKGEAVCVSLSAHGNHTAEISLHGEDDLVFCHRVTSMEADAIVKCVRGITATPPPVAGDVSNLRTALKLLIRGYVNLLETGRDRIKLSGGQCDDLEVMERNDPWLKEANTALTLGKQEGV